MNRITNPGEYTVEDAHRDGRHTQRWHFLNLCPICRETWEAVTQ